MLETFELRRIEDLSQKSSIVEIWQLPERYFCSRWVAVAFDRGMVLFNPTGERDPNVLEFHNIGVVDDKLEYFVITDKDKKPFGVWSREYHTTEQVFKKEYWRQGRRIETVGRGSL